MKAIVIGAGLGGLSAAAYLAKSGIDVVILEKNSWVGGRVRQWRHKGLRFDMGPSWYLMPAEFDEWFSRLGFQRKDFFEITRIDPSYKIIFENENLEVPSDLPGIIDLFERREQGSGARLKFFLSDLAREYSYLMKTFIKRNSSRQRDKISQGIDIMRSYKLKQLFQSYHTRIKQVAYDKCLQKILEYPTTFLGGSPHTIPAPYAILNHVDFNLGVWYPTTGGFSALPEAMAKVCRKLGVKIHCNEEVQSLDVQGSTIHEVQTKAGTYQADVVVANADRHFVDQYLLPHRLREMSPRKWNSLPMAPAVLNIFLGVKDPLDSFAHHTFFFDSDWDDHIDAVYSRKTWPDDPLFYVHCPAKTDASAASKGLQPVFALVPLAPGLIDSPIERNRVIESVLERMQQNCSTSLQEAIRFSKVESIHEYSVLFHAYKGNAFGLAMTLSQTAMFRLSNRSKKVKNLYFSGQYTVPGTGTTMASISGRLTAARILEEMSIPRI